MQRNEHGRPRIGGWPLAAGITVVLAFLFFDRRVLPPFILAAAAAFLLTPVVDGLRRRARLPRSVAAVVVYFGFVIALGAAAYFIGVPMVREATALTVALPTNLHRLIAELAPLAEHFFGHAFDLDSLADGLLGNLQALAGSGMLLSFAGSGVRFAVDGTLFIVLLVYFLISGPTIANGAFWLIPPEYRSDVRAVAAKLMPILWRYFLGLAIIVSYATLVAWIGFTFVFHLAEGALLAMFIGLLELVPLVGPALSIALVSLTAVQQTGLASILGLVGFAVAIRLSIDQVVGPLVLGEATRLHPIVVIFSFLSGAVLFGVLGLLLAVPVAASIKIVLATYYAEPVKDRREARRSVSGPR